jgi:hypothetical protein
LIACCGDDGCALPVEVDPELVTFVMVELWSGTTSVARLTTYGVGWVQVTEMVDVAFVVTAA